MKLQPIKYKSAWLIPGGKLLAEFSEAVEETNMHYNVGYVHFEEITTILKASKKRGDTTIKDNRKLLKALYFILNYNFKTNLVAEIDEFITLPKKRVIKVEKDPLIPEVGNRYAVTFKLKSFLNNKEFYTTITSIRGSVIFEKDVYDCQKKEFGRHIKKDGLEYSVTNLNGSSFRELTEKEQVIYGSLIKNKNCEKRNKN
jgi:hypothetical protein